jgi:hypothetical protein
MSSETLMDATAQERPVRTSALLRDFAASVSGERVTVAQIAATLGDRGLGVLIAIFALPNVVPSVVPFGNTLWGLPPLIFAVQLTLGLKLMLPGALSRQTIASSTLKTLAPRLSSILFWFERALTPRLPWVTGPTAERVIGLVCIVLALTSMLPIPFGHNLPSLGLVLIGLGLIERDGLAILAGTAIGLIGAALLGIVVLVLGRSFQAILHATILRGF